MPPSAAEMKERISTLSDPELIAMIESKARDYTPDAIAIAKEIIKERGGIDVITIRRAESERNEKEKLERKLEHQRLADTQSTEDSSFNFGAACLTPLWLMFHGKPLTGVLLILYGLLSRIAFVFGAAGIVLSIIVDLVIMIYFGIQGNKIAMIHRGYPSIEDTKVAEQGWNIAGGIAGVVMILIIIGQLATSR
jgi:hypothetical protein